MCYPERPSEQSAIAMLNTILHGTPGNYPPLLIAHGLFGSARNWGAVAKLLATERQVIAVDMRNHGLSPADRVHTYPAMAEDLEDVVDAHGGQADVLGHSMGGKAAMTLALTAQQKVRRLLVADIAPVAYSHSQIEYVRAMQSVDPTGLRRRSEADAQLARSVNDPMLRAFFLQSLSITADGASWKLNLDALSDQMPYILGFPDLTGTFPGPSLFLCGETSDYVQQSHWPLIRTRFPAAEKQILAGTGHWLHADTPHEFAAAVSAFLLSIKLKA